MKTIHHIPCIRSKVTSMAVYRPGGLNLTRQFDHNTVMDIASDADDAIYGIQMEQGLCRQPFKFRVRRFRPRETDIVHRRFMDGGRPVRQDAGAFCLADVEATARDFKHYIDRNALAGLTEAAKDSDPIVRDVFGMIVKHCASLPVSPPSTSLHVVADPLHRLPSKWKTPKPQTEKTLGRIQTRRNFCKRLYACGLPSVSDASLLDILLVWLTTFRARDRFSMARWPGGFGDAP